ncbi:MAG: hypothetical protein Aurels2KO_25470 [Aureliella sp.]
MLWISIAINCLLLYFLRCAHLRVQELWETLETTRHNYASCDRRRLKLSEQVDALEADNRKRRIARMDAKQLINEADAKLKVAKGKLHAVFLFCFLPLLGCTPDVPRVVSVQPPAAEIPTVNLPESLRQKNWVSRTNGQGSCVHASSVAHFNWQGRYKIAEGWKRRYSGGETAYSILNKWIDNRIPFTYTDSGDPAFLQWATDTRRGAIIWYYPSHCVTFCGFAVVDGRDYAYILDNNRINRFIAVDKSEFIRNWRGFGGFAATAVFTAAGPLPWPAYVPERT